MGQTVGLALNQKEKKRMTELKSPAPEKRKFALWINKDTIDRAKKSYKDDNCSSASEFIEKAICSTWGTCPARKTRTTWPRLSPPP